MSIKYRFMEAGVTQTTLAGMIETILKNSKSPYRCLQCDVSNTFGKVARKERLTEKEQIIYNTALDILEGLENGKTQKEND